MSLDSFPQSIPAPEEEHRERLYEDMASSGRLIAHTWITPDRAALRGGKFEWQDVVDEERKGRHMVKDTLVGRFGNQSFNALHSLFGEKVSAGSHEYRKLTGVQNIDAALTIEQMVEREAMWKEEKRLEKPHWYSPPREVTRRVRAGEKETPIRISEINGENSADTAYRVVLVENVKGLVAGRPGVTCTYQLLLPEHLAREAFRLLSERPSAIREIVQKFDSVMARQLDFVENNPKRLLVIPEGAAEQAYELDAQWRPQRIREEFVKNIHT
jgi:hypothetical protein